MNSKLIYLALFICFISTTCVFADESNLRVQKDHISEIMKVYKAENDKMFTPRINKVSISKPKPRRNTSAIKTNNEQVKKSTAPATYDFSNSTTWGNFKVTVIEYPGQSYFRVSFESPYPVQNIEIINSNTKNRVLNQNFNDEQMASVQVNFVYEPVYLLIIKANINDEIQPNIIPLYKKAAVKYK